MNNKDIKATFDIQYWLIVVNLLKQGISYEAIIDLTDYELSLVLGIVMALNQQEQENLEREQRQTQMRSI